MSANCDDIMLRSAYLPEVSSFGLNMSGVTEQADLLSR